MYGYTLLEKYHGCVLFHLPLKNDQTTIAVQKAEFWGGTRIYAVHEYWQTVVQRQCTCIHGSAVFLRGRTARSISTNNLFSHNAQVYSVAPMQTTKGLFFPKRETLLY